jgi:predicted nucleic acid-binding protein
MIFIESNIPMYLVGAPHPHKVDAQRLLENLLSERVRLVTGAEVLQELLHRYVAIDCRDAIQPAFDAILGIVDRVLPINFVAAERKKVSSSDRIALRLATHCILRLWNSIPLAESCASTPASTDILELLGSPHSNDIATRRQ